MIPFELTTISRFEHISDISFTANTVQNLPSQGGQIVDNRWLWGLHLLLEGRATMPAAGGPSALEADGYPALMERITVEGFHRVEGRNEKFFDMRGAEAQFISDLFTLNALPTEPASTNFAASATNDFRRHILVPFVPLGISTREMVGYLLDVPNYDTLKLSIQWGDAASIFSAGTVPTLTAYNSTTGNPRVRVAGYWALSGPGRFANRVPGRTFRYFQEVTGSISTTTATAVRVIDIPRGNFMRAVLLKTGVKSTDITAGNNAYASLSETILANLKFNRGINRPIRFYPNQQQVRAEMALQRGFAGRAGYASVDFAGRGVLAESFDARSLVSGPSGQVDFFFEADVTGAANQAIVFLWEEIQRTPVSSTAGRSR